MLTKRIIACLDVTAGRVVKGIKFLNLRDAGDPAELAASHSANGADEVVLLDISATHENRATLVDTVRRTAKELFIPFTVGGGIRTLQNAARDFRRGCGQSQHQFCRDCGPRFDYPDCQSVWLSSGDCGDRCQTVRTNPENSRSSRTEAARPPDATRSNGPKKPRSEGRARFC